MPEWHGRMCFTPGAPNGGGGGGGQSKSDCETITAAVGFAGLDYAIATEVWNDLAKTKGANNVAVAALGVVTWSGESSFSLRPKNQGNDNGSVDIGPFQVNYPLWKSGVQQSQRRSVFGTNLSAGQTFNGNPDANITVGLSYLNYLYGKFGDQAAGLYLAGTTRIEESASPRLTHRRASWKAFSATLNAFRRDNGMRTATIALIVYVAASLCYGMELDRRYLKRRLRGACGEAK